MYIRIEAHGRFLLGWILHLLRMLPSLRNYSIELNCLSWQVSNVPTTREYTCLLCYDAYTDGGGYVWETGIGHALVEEGMEYPISHFNVGIDNLMLAAILPTTIQITT